jgi:hypothetical protein
MSDATARHVEAPCPWRLAMTKIKATSIDMSVERRQAKLQ